MKGSAAGGMGPVSASQFTDFIMLTRREFLRRAGLFSGGIGAMSALPRSILKAAGIEPAEGSSFLDAGHVVILMQENRSFDHAFGALRGVRGFDDPRAITIPGGRPVWLQSDTKGDTYAPFPLKIFESSSTWMSSLPHDRHSEVAAGNGGKHDRWLPVMKSGIEEYEGMPLTLGYYDRQDIPFYYALADAFTVCDQHFCSLQTSTTPNRLYLWTGMIDPTSTGGGPVIDNTEPAPGFTWMTYPERLETAGVSWRIYQEPDNYDDNALAIHIALFDTGTSTSTTLLNQSVFLTGTMAVSPLPTKI
jgi:phospholipase C